MKLPNRRSLLLGGRSGRILALFALVVISSLSLIGLTAETVQANEPPTDFGNHVEDESKEIAIESYRWMIEAFRNESWATDIHLQILEDYWVTDEELAKVEQLYKYCVASAFPGAYVEFLSPMMSNIVFADAEQEEYNFRNAPCFGIMGLVRPLHFMMRVNPELESQESFIRRCLSRRGIDFGNDLDDKQFREAIWADDFSETNPDAWECVAEVSALG